MQIATFTFNALAENTYVLFDQTGEAVIVDPGCYHHGEQAALRNFIEEKQLTVKYLLNTHTHVDHVLGNAYVKRTFGVPLLLSKEEEAGLRAVQLYAPMYGFHAYETAEADAFLAEGDFIRFGQTELQVLFVPGHSVGHLAFYSVAAGMCVAGDVLFRQSIGRTDLPGGDFDTLLKSIRMKLYTLPDGTVVYAGHGPETTIGYEKKYNPFCAVV